MKKGDRVRRIHPLVTLGYRPIGRIVERDGSRIDIALSPEVIAKLGYGPDWLYAGLLDQWELCGDDASCELEAQIVSYIDRELNA